MKCTKCRADVPHDASRCPYCAYDPSKDGRLTRFIVWCAAMLCSLTGIGVIVGLPLFVLHDKMSEKAENRTVGSPA